MTGDRTERIHDLLQEQIELAGLEPDTGEVDYQRLFALVSKTYQKAEQDRQRARQNTGLMTDEMRSLYGDVEKASNARLQAETRYSQAIEELDLGFAYFDPDDRLVAFNRQYQEMLFPDNPDQIALGYSFERIIRAYRGLPIDADCDQPDQMDLLRNRLALHHSPVAPFSSQSHTGRWYLVCERKTREGGIVSMLTDITETKQRELQALRNEQYSNLYNDVILELSHSKAVMTGNLETALREISEVAAKILNVERVTVWLFDVGHAIIRCKNVYEKTPNSHKIGPELLATKYPGFFEDIHNNKTVVVDNVHGGERVRELLEEILRPLNIYSMIYAPIKGPGHAEGTIAVSHVGAYREWTAPEVKFVTGLADIVGMAIKAEERHQSRKRMLAVIEQAEMANRSKSEFLANMSHELRTPLNSILGFAELLQLERIEPLTQEQTTEYAGDIYNSGRLLLDLINDILDISKIEAGGFELREEWVEVENVIAICIRLIKERANDQGLELEADISQALPILWADERALKQILLNLLSNAVKFTPSGGKISVTAGIDPDGNFRLAVADTGVGIASADLQKALLPFVQLDNELIRKHTGTGLGLPLVKSLVDMHGGKLDIKSQPGAGTSVVVQFPASRIQARQNKMSAAE